MKWIAYINMKTFYHISYDFISKNYLFSQKGKKPNWFTVLADEIHSYEEKTNMQRTLKKKTSNHYFQINMLLINISGWRTCIIQGKSKNLNTEHFVLMVMGIQNHINLEIHCFLKSFPTLHSLLQKVYNFFFNVLIYVLCEWIVKLPSIFIVDLTEFVGNCTCKYMSLF